MPSRFLRIAVIAAFAFAVQTVSAQVHTLTPIKYLVVLFQENVSFDHYFATYPDALNPEGEPVFFPRQDVLTPSVNGLTGPLLARNPNSEAPFRLSRAQAVTCDQSHDYTREQQAFDHGLMDKFVEFTSVSTASCALGLGRKLVMGYYDGNTVTALWNYAQYFAMSDNFFGTTFGPSTPGAMNLIAGQTNGARVVRDTGNAAAQVVADTVIADVRSALDDCVPASQSTVVMARRNVGDLLNDAGITWGWFQGGFAPTSRDSAGNAVCGAAHPNIAGVSQTDYVPHHEPFQYWQSTANPHHLPPESTSLIGSAGQANHQYDLTEFWNASQAGYLPAVSFLKAAAYQDGHASNSDPLDEQTYLVNTINALQNLPQWNDMAIIITYDDSDGWYDHVMPPVVSPSAIPSDALTGSGACGPSLNHYQGRCGYGPRLPFLLISPWARGDYVDHTVLDQSSVTRFIEDNWNLDRIGDTAFDEIAGSILNMFDFRPSAPRAAKLFLDPDTGAVTNPPHSQSHVPSR